MAVDGVKIMNQRAWNGVTAAALTLAGVASHALPHAMGVSTVGAVGMLAAAYLPKRYAAMPVLATVLIVDAMTGFYAILAMGIVYLAHLLAMLAARRPLASIGIGPIAIAAIVNAFVFFLVSNLSPMAMGYYPNTVEGWIACYVAALPFLLRGILANMVYGGIAFGMIALLGKFDAHRILVTQRD